MGKHSYFCVFGYGKRYLESKACCGVRQDETRQPPMKEILITPRPARGGKHRRSKVVAHLVQQVLGAFCQQRQRSLTLELSFWLEVDGNEGGRVLEGGKHSK